MPVPKQQALFIAQSGGPTSVINSTLAGIVTQAQKLGISRIYGLIHGLEGALKNDIVDLSLLTRQQLVRLAATPGAFLGGSRYPLQAGDLEKVCDFLEGENCRYLLLIGGNGTMDTGLKLHKLVREKGLKLDIVGAPKTVDNDLHGIDFSPGYPSAAQYIALAVRDQILDLAAMKAFEQVRVIETMGRQVGWLAAAGFMAYNPTTTVNPLFIPEHRLDEPAFLRAVEKAYQIQGFAVAVIGEGITNSDGQPLGATPFAGMADGGCHTVHVGSANYLADLVAQTLGVRARAQILGMNQRCFQGCVSNVDQAQAFALGQAGANLAQTGGGGNMVTVKRVDTGYQADAVPFESVAGIERLFPEEFYDKTNKRVTQGFVDWLSPLLNDIVPTMNPDEIPALRRR
ncbi:MAG: diphosphate--fructose-6-phosphate 1-phosphotransferase [Negativicutes bacterium]|nr:diphosphate--fructose-6-phosphate 1-phosphotransferase [Negativicutes bacterium]